MGAGAVQIADTACRHGAVGLGAARYLLAVEARLIDRLPEEREAAQTLILPVGEHLREEAVGVVTARLLALVLGTRRIQDGLTVSHQLGTPLRSRQRGVKGCQAVAQRADVFLQGIVHDTVGQPVDARHIEFQVGGQLGAVVGEQSATLGRRVDRAVKHRVGLLVPQWSLHNGELEHIPDDPE